MSASTGETFSQDFKRYQQQRSKSKEQEWGMEAEGMGEEGNGEGGGVEGRGERDEKGVEGGGGGEDGEWSGEGLVGGVPLALLKARGVSLPCVRAPKVRGEDEGEGVGVKAKGGVNQLFLWYRYRYVALWLTTFIAGCSMVQHPIPRLRSLAEKLRLPPAALPWALLSLTAVVLMLLGSLWTSQQTSARHEEIVSQLLREKEALKLNFDEVITKRSHGQAELDGLRQQVANLTEEVGRKTKEAAELAAKAQQLAADLDKAKKDTSAVDGLKKDMEEQKKKLTEEQQAAAARAAKAEEEVKKCRDEAAAKEKKYVTDVREGKVAPPGADEIADLLELSANLTQRVLKLEGEAIAEKFQTEARIRTMLEQAVGSTAAYPEALRQDLKTTRDACVRAGYASTELKRTVADLSIYKHNQNVAAAAAAAAGKTGGAAAAAEGEEEPAGPLAVCRSARCKATDEELSRFMNYTEKEVCPDDWFFVQELIFDRGCHCLPRRRCFAANFTGFQDPMPFPNALWNESALMDTNGDYFHGRSFPSDQQHSPHRIGHWRRLGQFCCPDAGIQLHGADHRKNWANPKEKNSTEPTGVPYMEAVAARGLVPLYLPFSARLPFYDNTIDVIHTGTSINDVDFEEFEEMFYDWDRVLRPGGVIWFDLFYSQVRKMPLYMEIVDMFKYDQLHRAVTPSLGAAGLYVHMSFVLQKPPLPVRQSDSILCSQGVGRGSESADIRRVGLSAWDNGCAGKKLPLAASRLLRQSRSKSRTVARVTPTLSSAQPAPSLDKEISVAVPDFAKAIPLGRHTLNDLITPVENDLQMLNENLKSVVGARHPVLMSAAEQIFGAGGKRMRPALVLLVALGTAQLMGLDGIQPKQRRLAEISEMLHTASLMHDDVLDDSSQRRGKATVHQLYGTRLISQVIADFANGEIQQAASLFDADLTFEQYTEKSFFKTASLIAASTKSAAIFSGCPPEACNAMFDYGKHLGLSFQVVDDILDFTQTTEQLGKPAGSDLASGNLTAPALFALRHPTIGPQLRELVDSEFVEEGSLEQAVELVLASGGVEKARAMAEEHGRSAKRALDMLPEGDAKRSLLGMVDYVLERLF
ncbi:unnamed protein product [Closterium sp. Yama58-4]|nr:unnamed protein product [Closterium sp. Yama58-4]